MRLITIIAAMIFMLGSQAHAIVIGNDAIDRGDADGRNNFAIAMGSDIFPDGQIEEWSVFVQSVSAFGTNTVALLILEDQGANQWEVVATDYQVVVQGLNTFNVAIQVSSGQVLGAFMSNARVSVLNQNGIGIPATVDQTFSLGTQPGMGTLLFGANNDLQRIYSLNARLVPLPASGFLLLGAMAGLVWIRRRNATA